MRVLITELKKLFSNKIFLLLIVAVFVINAYLMFRAANTAEITPSDYRSMYAAMEGLTDEEKLDFLDDCLNDSTGKYDYNWSLRYELQEECYNIVHYKSYLENIKAQAKSMTSISIFAKPETFNYRSIVKTPSAYENVQDVQPIFDVSQGILLATDNSFTDILCGFLLLFAVLSIMLSDREQGMSGLLFSMKRGRGYLLRMKIGALAVALFAAVLFLYTENLLIAQDIYGLGDLSRPVQSLNGFIGCNLKLSVFGYLVLYMMFKFLSLFVIGVVLTLIAVNTRNTVSFFGISAVILVAEGVAYSKIEPLSIYSIFRYLNLIAFTKGNEIFCNYKNINFWNSPISLIPASIGAVVGILLICVGLSGFLYARKRNLAFRRIGLKFRMCKGNKMHSQLYYTFYKSLILQKGLLILLLFVAVAGFLSQTFVKEYDITDAYYKYYTTQLEGEITQETLDFCDSESDRFNEINAQIAQLQETTDGFSKELNDLQNDLAPSLGFYPFQERVNQIKDMENVQIFYDTGYKRAFGIAGYDDDMKYALATMLLCILLISPLIASDNKYRMGYMINSTCSGKRHYLYRNSIATSVYSLIASLLWIVPYAKAISVYYGHSGLSASIRSITEFFDFPLNLTVLQYIILLCILRVFAILCTALIMLWISSRCSSTISAVLINFALFALPILIYLLGAKFMINIGFSPLLSMNIIFNDFSVVQVVVPVIVIAIAFWGGVN